MTLPLALLTALAAAEVPAPGPWPGFRPADHARADGGAAERILMDAAEGAEELSEIAQRAAAIASAFRDWASETIPAGPGYGDAEEPAPPGWAARAAPRLATEEAAAVLRALEAEGGDRQARAKAVLRVRFRRVAVLTAGAMSTLRRSERSEGLALYTALRSLELAEGPEAERLARALRDLMTARLREAAAGEIDRYEPAISGCALALLADRVRPDWRERLLAEGLALDVILAGPPHVIR